MELLEFLTGLFGENQTITLDDLKTAVSQNKDVKFADLKDGGYVDAGKYNDVVKDLNMANQTINTLQNTAKTYEGVDVMGLQTELAQLKDKYDQDIKQQKIDAAIALALTKAGAINVKAAKALLEIDPEKAEFDGNGELKGLTEKLEALKTAEDSKMLFQQATKPKIKGFDPAEGNTDTDGIQEPATLAEAIKLSLSAQSDAN